MNPALIVSIVSSSLLAVATVTAAWFGFRGQRRAAAAQEKVGMVDAAIDGLNETVGTLRNELTIARTEVAHLRNKCNILGRNTRLVTQELYRLDPSVSLSLEEVPNGF